MTHGRIGLAATRGLVAILAVGVLVSLGIGRVMIGPRELLAVLLDAVAGRHAYRASELTRIIVVDVRLPRVLTAGLVGACLAASGAAYQGVFRNPLVSPDILGVSAGAGFGAALAILGSLPAAGVQGAAFVSAVAAVGISCGIGARCQRQQAGPIGLVLGGMVVASIFSAALSMTKLLADPENKLPAITFWLMGSLASVTLRDLALMVLPMGLASVVLLRVAWHLNVLSFGDDEARSLGMNVTRMRSIVIVASTVVTACSISVCGIVGWVGLMAPHIARMVIGPNYRVLMPAAMLMGGIVLLLMDDLARTISAGEIPLGILTSLLGGPFFLWLMVRRNSVWN